MYFRKPKQNQSNIQNLIISLMVSHEKRKIFSLLEKKYHTDGHQYFKFKDNLFCCIQEIAIK